MKKRNYQMDVLSTFGIIFVVLGHIYNSNENSILTIYGLFPYYSFHLSIFLFITGYFYKEESENNMVNFIVKKFKQLIIPFYCVNAAFLVVQTLLTKCGYSIGSTFSVQYLVMLPIQHFQPMTFSIASWYLAALFIAEIFFVLQRKIKNILGIQDSLLYELLLMAILIVTGLLLQSFFDNNQDNQMLGVFIRSYIMTYYIHLGFMYKRFLEEHDTVCNTKYFTVLVLIQFIIFILARNKNINFGIYGLDKNGTLLGAQYYFTGITGIALWLRISKIIAKLPESKIVSVIGSHTKDIMFYHLFGIFLLNTMIYPLFLRGKALNWIGAFNVEKYKTNIYYACIESKKMIIVYLLFSIVVSLSISRVIVFFKTHLFYTQLFVKNKNEMIR